MDWTATAAALGAVRTVPLTEELMYSPGDFQYTRGQNARLLKSDVDVPKAKL